MFVWIRRLILRVDRKRTALSVSHIDIIICDTVQRGKVVSLFSLREWVLSVSFVRAYQTFPETHEATLFLYYVFVFSVVYIFLFLFGFGEHYR